MGAKQTCRRRRKPNTGPCILQTSSAASVAPPLDWSTSYQAGSSSSAVQSSSDEASSTEEESPQTTRGRQYVLRKRRGSRGPLDLLQQRTESPNSRPPPGQISASSDDSGSGSSKRHTRAPFTRSRSPAVKSSSLSVHRNGDSSKRKLSPSINLFSRFQIPVGQAYKTVLPTAIEVEIPIWNNYTALTVYIDARRAGECLILLASALTAASRLSSLRATNSELHTHADNLLWSSLELWMLAIASFIYLIWAHSSISKHASVSQASPRLISFCPLAVRFHHHSLPNRTDSSRDRKSMAPLSAARKPDFGFIWMSVPKNYRESSDDGILTACLLGPLIASALLYSTLQRLQHPADQSVLPPGWLVENPIQLAQSPSFTPLHFLALARFNILDLATFCSTIILIHVCSSFWLEARHSRRANTPEGERSSVPRSEGNRFWYYVMFTVGISSALLAIKVWLEATGIGIWQHMNHFELSACGLFYQFTLYVALRLAHRGFTLGELGLVCFGGTALFMELLNITIARIWPITTLYIKTYRLPTPLLVFQVALIAGSFLTGFILSPFLVLSRHIAQRPVRRFRSAEEKLRQRRYLALGFYVGALLIVGGLIGIWTRWCLGSRDPWIWVVFYLLEGRRKWSRPVLLAYWGLLVSISVAGWNRQLARSRKIKTRSTTVDGVFAPEAANASPAENPSISVSGLGSPGALNITFSNLNALPNAAQVSTVATDLLDAADKHVPTLSLNARRKFFHALAVVMFVPGIALDPAFTHLSFSVAFALFTFAEYVRYFAVYPFGAAIHVFMNDFLDHKDNGTAILSHFYLLTGCSGSLWLEGLPRLSEFTGILTLGIGDALASIVGKRIGTHRWSPTTTKTIEGSIAFTTSIVSSAWVLRLLGFVDPFSTTRYTIIVAISSVLEALSVQNDNLTLPLFMWSILQLSG